MHRQYALRSWHLSVSASVLSWVSILFCAYKAETIGGWTPSLQLPITRVDKAAFISAVRRTCGRVGDAKAPSSRIQSRGYEDGVSARHPVSIGAYRKSKNHQG